MINLVKRPIRSTERLRPFKLIDFVGISLAFSLILLFLIFLIFDVQFIR